MTLFYYAQMSKYYEIGGEKPMKDIKTSMMLYQGEQFETDDLDNR